MAREGLARPRRRKHFPGEEPRAQTAVAAGRLTHPDWQLAIYGSGPERPHLQSMIDEHGLNNTITLAGHVDDLPEILRSVGLFVLSSRYEGFPMVLLEAMSCAVPVVAFDCPTGPSELIHDRVTGRLVPAGKTAELAAAINSLIEQPSPRNQLGQAAAAHAQTYDRDLIATRWEVLFERLHGARMASTHPK